MRSSPFQRGRTSLQVALIAASLTLFALVTPAQAGTAVRLQVEDLVQHADLVLEGRVVAERCVAGPRGRIDTEYTLSVGRTFWGEHQSVRVVRLPGGRLDGRELTIPGMPRLTVGEDALLFLAPEAAHMRMPVGLAQGKLRIVTDVSGRRALVREHGEVSLVDPHTSVVRRGGTRVVRYDEFVGRIEGAVTAKRARLRAAQDASDEAGGK